MERMQGGNRGFRKNKSGWGKSEGSTSKRLVEKMKAVDTIKQFIRMILKLQLVGA